MLRPIIRHVSSPLLPWPGPLLSWPGSLMLRPIMLRAYFSYKTYVPFVNQPFNF